jgi:hypothetical protein
LVRRPGIKLWIVPCLNVKSSSDSGNGGAKAYMGFLEVGLRETISSICRTIYPPHAVSHSYVLWYSVEYSPIAMQSYDRQIILPWSGGPRYRNASQGGFGLGDLFHNRENIAWQDAFCEDVPYRC